MRSTLLTAYLLLTSCVLIAGFQFSDNNCNTWTPVGVTAERQKSEPPYTFEPSDMYFEPGDIITVKVASQDEGPAFQNVFLQTVCEGSSPTCPMAMYGVWSEADTASTIVDCGTDEKVAIFATANEDRRLYTAIWTAPEDAPDKISIWATVVHNDTTWWSEIKVAQLTTHSLMCSSAQDLFEGGLLYGCLQIMCILIGIFI